MYRVVMALAVCACCAPAARPDEKPKTDRDRLQGSWTFVALSLFGNQAPQDYLTKLRAEIDGKRLVIKPGLLVESSSEQPEVEWKLGSTDGDQFTFELDATAKPKAIDITVVVNGEKVTLKGIYELDGDALKICFGEQRPKDFSAESTARTVFYVLKRDKK
jgi:uncharacterized protein (TIGR03067 family)